MYGSAVPLPSLSSMKLLITDLLLSLFESIHVDDHIPLHRILPFTYDTGELPHFDWNYAFPFVQFRFHTSRTHRARIPLCSEYNFHAKLKTLKRTRRLTETLRGSSGSINDSQVASESSHSQQSVARSPVPPDIAAVSDMDPCKFCSPPLCAHGCHSMSDCRAFVAHFVLLPARRM